MKKKPKAKKDRRKKPRAVHVINERTRPRDRELARADLANFFLGSIDKHHGF